MSTGVVALSVGAAFFLGASATAVVASEKLVDCTVPPRFAAGGGMATPLPNPVLATVPRAPFAPPVPLPYPGPAGRAGEPNEFMFVRLLAFPVAATPSGSPNPPVWTLSRGRGLVIVAGAELPVVIIPV